MADIAQRVIELYWPQTLPYSTTGAVLLQNQAGGQATIVSDILRFRDAAGLSQARTLPPSVKGTSDFTALSTRVERALAEWPVPRAQAPYAPFLFDFDWTWEGHGGWSVKRYAASSRSLHLHEGVASALARLGPLLRPFIVRWWTEKAAQLNKDVSDAQSVMAFEDFLFGRDRVALRRVGESLLDLQRGECFYCGRSIAQEREIDHFVAWSRSGDDGLDNLVAACPTCNNAKRAALAGPRHLNALVQRNDRWTADLTAIARERQWPRDRGRSSAVQRATYLAGSTGRPVWEHEPSRGSISRTFQADDLEAAIALLGPARAG